MPTDPLSEAREALRKFLPELGPSDCLFFELRDALARLDALPAPGRFVAFGGATGWFYPDAPAARNGELTTPDEPRPPADAEPSDEQEEGTNPATTEDVDAR